MDNEQLRLICETALREAHFALEKTGQEGFEEVETEKDIVTKGDLAVSEALKEYFKKSGIPARIDSEELGQLDMSENPEFRIVVDEIDGTKNFETGKGTLPYCTAVAIFGKVEKPRFDDCEVAGIIEHRSGHVWIATREGGCYYNDRLCRPSNRRQLDRKTVVVIDLYQSSGAFQGLGEVIGSGWPGDFKSAALHLAGVASGMFGAYVNPGNKPDELGAGYRLVKENEGTILLWDGTNLGNAVYDRNKTYPIVAAGSEDIARDVLRKIPEDIREEAMRKAGFA
ncbi:MAG: hypothetical protein HYW25_03005 [Candidatus Aenigmarchaeota archaeon]|nr:hypothetical protein [Candidatus Aenigmarchaeota archaeon]